MLENEKDFTVKMNCSLGRIAFQKHPIFSRTQVYSTKVRTRLSSSAGALMVRGAAGQLVLRSVALCSAWG